MRCPCLHKTIWSGERRSQESGYQSQWYPLLGRTNSGQTATANAGDTRPIKLLKDNIVSVQMANEKAIISWYEGYPVGPFKPTENSLGSRNSTTTNPTGGVAPRQVCIQPWVHSLRLDMLISFDQVNKLQVLGLGGGCVILYIWNINVGWACKSNEVLQEIDTEQEDRDNQWEKHSSSVCPQRCRTVSVQDPNRTE